jgi:hypothetical protein
MHAAQRRKGSRSSEGLARQRVFGLGVKQQPARLRHLMCERSAAEQEAQHEQEAQQEQSGVPQDSARSTSASSSTRRASDT